MARVQGVLSVPIDLAVVEEAAESGGIVLPSGSTWSDVLMAFAAAKAGSTIFLPNETITQTSGLSIKKRVNIKGQGPLSNLKHIGNISMSGSGRCIEIDVPDGDDLVFENFGIEGDQTQNQNNRTQAFVLMGGMNVHFRGLRLKTISANCFNLKSPPLEPLKPIKNIYIEGCSIDQWWEQFVEIGGQADNIQITKNNAKTSTRNQGIVGGSPGVMPFGLAVTLENPHADMINEAKDVLFAGNTIDFTGLDVADAHGCQISEGSRTKQWRYDRIQCIGNTFIRCGSGFRYQGSHSADGVNTGSTITCVNNHMEQCLVAPAVIHPPAAVQTCDMADIVTMVGNSWRGGQLFFKQFNTVTHSMTIIDTANKRLI